MIMNILIPINITIFDTRRMYVLKRSVLNRPHLTSATKLASGARQRKVTVTNTAKDTLITSLTYKLYTKGLKIDCRLG